MVEHISDMLKDEATYGKGEVDIIYSGGRGFYVRKKISKSVDVDEARNLMRENIVKPLTAYFANAVDAKPKVGEIRIDLSPMKTGGSYRAPFSVNSSTGLVALPLSDKEFSVFEKHMALPNHVSLDRHAKMHWNKK